MSRPANNKPPQEVAQGIWFIEAPLNGVSVAIYVLRGERLAVVDTGYSFHPAAVIVPSLRQLGFSPGDVDLILNTHGHPDHLGGNANLQRLTGARICLHGDDCPMAAGADAHIASATDHIMAMRALGWDDEVAVREAFLRQRVDGCRVDQVLRDGDMIDLGAGLSIRVVSTPGHTPGSVTFHIESRTLAIIGDAVQGWGVSPSVLPLFYDPHAYFKSLEKIGQLGIGTLCLGHDVQWPKSGPSSSPVRTGTDVDRTLEASAQFAVELAHAAKVAPKGAALAERVVSVAMALQPPFQVNFDAHERFAAASAATILSQLNKPYDPQEAIGKGQRQ